MQLASAFSETTKLAKRVRELEDVDAELEEYRQVCIASQVDPLLWITTYPLVASVLEAYLLCSCKGSCLTALHSPMLLQLHMHQPSSFATAVCYNPHSGSGSGSDSSSDGLIQCGSLFKVGI